MILQERRKGHTTEERESGSYDSSPKPARLIPLGLLEMKATFGEPLPITVGTVPMPAEATGP